jgi:hypothetical protein
VKAIAQNIAAKVRNSPGIFLPLNFDLLFGRWICAARTMVAVTQPRTGGWAKAKATARNGANPAGADCRITLQARRVLNPWR